MMLGGHYVEIDHEQLQQALSHWQSVQHDVGQDGVSFIEGMRLLAGASHGLSGTDFSENIHERSGVQASDELRTLLKKFRHPETIKAKNLSEELQATLRPY
jgi:non-specific serine/threonine protein kinase